MTENIDKLTEDSNLMSKFGLYRPSINERDVHVLIENKLPYKRKEMFMEGMLKYCEDKIIKRRTLLYQKKVNEIIEMTNHKIDFQKRTRFIETSIE